MKNELFIFFPHHFLFAYIYSGTCTRGKFGLVTNVSHTLAEVCIKCSHIFQMIRGIGNTEVPFSNGIRICDPWKLLSSNFAVLYVLFLRQDWFLLLNLVSSLSGILYKFEKNFWQLLSRFASRIYLKDSFLIIR